MEHKNIVELKKLGFTDFQINILAKEIYKITFDVNND